MYAKNASDPQPENFTPLLESYTTKNPVELRRKHEKRPLLTKEHVSSSYSGPSSSYSSPDNDPKSSGIHFLRSSKTLEELLRPPNVNSTREISTAANRGKINAARAFVVGKLISQGK